MRENRSVLRGGIVQLPPRVSSKAVDREDRRIRLAIVVHSMMRGGAERQIFELMRGIDRTRFNTSLVVFNTAQNAYPAEAFTDCKVLLKQETGSASLLRRSISLLLACYRLTVALKECKAQVVHAYLPMPSALTAVACGLLRVPVFIVGRRNMASFHRRGKRLLEWADRFPLRYATAIAGNCEAITKEIVEIDRFPAQRAFTIYNGVDTDRFTAVRNPRLRAELGFPVSGFVFGIVASFHKRKRHIDFVHAAKEISDHIPHARFLMIGEDRGTLREIRQYIEAQSLAGRFVILEGTAEPEKYYACMDCYISTSEIEGLSNSILEAMASGIPIIATNVGGTAEIVTHGESGILVSPYAPEEVAHSARLLANDLDLCARMGRCGRALAESKFSLRSMVDAHERLYRALLSGHLPTCTKEGTAS